MGQKAKPRRAEKSDAAKQEITALEASKTFGSMLSRVTFAGESFTITRYGKPVARLVPVDAAA